jgi:prophage regulatory protein
MSNTEVTKLLTITELLELTGYKSRSTIYRLMRQDRCPPPVIIGGRVRWRTDSIGAWLNALPVRTLPTQEGAR